MVILGTFANLITALRGYPIDIIAYIINALLITYTILRHHLLDITVVVRKGLLYSIPTAIIGAGYFLVVSLAVNLFHIVTGYQVLLLSLAMAAVTAVAVQPLRDKVQSWIDKLFFREKYDSRLMLQRLSRTVASVLDLRRLTGMILDEVTTTMHIERVAFFLGQEKSGEFRLMAQRGLDQSLGLRLREDHPIVDWLSGHENALTRHDVDVIPQFKALWGQEREDLERMGAELFIPLNAKGELVGIFALGPKLSGETYSQDDQVTLTTLANQTAVALENARLYQASQRELAERVLAEEQIQASLREKEVLLKEIHHRVKNNLQVVSSLLDFQSEHIEDKQTLEVFKESQNRVRSMALVHEQLYQSKDLARIDFAEYIRSLIDYLFQSYGGNWDAITLKINVDDVLLGVDTAIPCGLIISELVSNSLRCAFPAPTRQAPTGQAGRACSERSESKGEIRIDLHSDDDKLTLMVSDNGVGFPEDLDFPNTQSLGLRLVNMLTRQLKGTVELDRSGGTAFKIMFARPKP